MELKSLKRLKTLMAIHDMSARELAAVAGYKSHTSMIRVLSGESKNVGDKQAIRIAKVFNVPFDDLFLIRASTPTGDSDQRLAS